MHAEHELVVQFDELFQGNCEAVGTEEGGCLRTDLTWSGGLTAADVEWDRYILDHLQGTRPIGVYPLVDGQVHWGCVDFDEGDQPSWVHAQNLELVLHEFGVTSWVERSRSKGYHVWVFLEDWTSAELVRTALLAACQLGSCPTKEINPKQTELADGKLGNYVRLPYPGWLARTDERPPDDARRVVLTTLGTPLALSTFVSTAMETRVPAAKLEPLQALYVPPKKPVPPVPPWRPGDASKSIRDRMGGLTWTIYQHGPLDGAGRGHTLYKLAATLREEGQLSYHEALDLLTEADMRWGKFHDRGDDHMVETLLQKAWGLA